MPCVRGIVVNLITSSDSKGLPEFPHPEVSSDCLIEPLDSFPSDVNSFSISPVDTNSLCVQRAILRGSVYVPSIPGVSSCPLTRFLETLFSRRTDQGLKGSQFWIQYSIEPLTAPSRYLFFKIFMNGRSISNWGINPTAQEAGCVKRALYEPEERWDQEVDGSIITHTHEGIETRYFHFLSNSTETSVANDGGLIEVHRAKGRKRRAPRLARYRTQEAYGIAFPSGGFLDRPEEVLHYDWLLIDPKHSPFASFRFHYRSWKNLRQLRLAPPSEELERGIVPGASNNETNSLSKEPQSRRPLPEIPEAQPLRME